MARLLPSNDSCILQPVSFPRWVPELYLPSEESFLLPPFCLFYRRFHEPIGNSGRGCLRHQQSPQHHKPFVPMHRRTICSCIDQQIPEPAIRISLSATCRAHCRGRWFSTSPERGILPIYLPTTFRSHFAAKFSIQIVNREKRRRIWVRKHYHNLPQT